MEATTKAFLKSPCFFKALSLPVLSLSTYQKNSDEFTHSISKLTSFKVKISLFWSNNTD